MHPSIGIDPERRFEFDPRLGVLGAKSDEAQVCIDLFRLNRGDLRRARKRAYLERTGAVRAVLMDYRNPGFDYEDHLNVIRAYKQGTAPYALAGRQALADCRKPLGKLLKTLGPLVGIRAGR